MRAKTETIELPSYSNTKPLRHEEEEDSLNTRSVELPKYDNTRPLLRAHEESRFKTAEKKTIKARALRFPDASKIHWRGWVHASKERVKERVSKALRVQVND